MAGSPKDNEEKLRRDLNAWKTLANEKAFAGMTVEQFETAISPSFTTRAQLDELDNQRTQLINARDDADEVSMAKAAAVVAGVLADPNFGPNSSLYEAMGYVRKSERATGLSRKGKDDKPGGGTPTP
jgi:hypothetical protein